MGATARVLLFLTAVVASTPARAQVAEPGPRPHDAFDAMNLLARRGWHDLEHERWNAYGQVTYIHQYKPSFSERYTNLGGSPNSLLPGAEQSFTVSAGRDRHQPRAARGE